MNTNTLCPYPEYLCPYQYIIINCNSTVGKSEYKAEKNYMVYCGEEICKIKEK